MKKLYRFYWDCRRMGDVSGLFVADDDKEIKPVLGKHVDFGEILGKYSQINGILKENDLEIVTDDQKFIEKFEQFGCGNGYNPLNYIVCGGYGNHKCQCEED